MGGGHRRFNVCVSLSFNVNHTLIKAELRLPEVTRVEVLEQASRPSR